MQTNAYTALSLLSGFGNGYRFAQAKQKEDEVKQGRNYILASLSICSQFLTLCTALKIINQSVPPYPGKLAVSVACQLTPILSLITAPLCGAVKSGHYKSFAKNCNQSLKDLSGSKNPLRYLRLPEKLRKCTVRVASILAEHTGNLIRIAMLASAVALIALGNAAFGGALLAAVAFQILDSRGFIPRRISLFMEIYMPIIMNVGILLSGIMIARVFAAISLLSSSPSFNRIFYHKIDSILRKKFPPHYFPGPSLKEIDAPLVEKKEMTFDEIQKILHSDPSDFTINPAHCNKPAIDLEKLPRDSNLNKYMTLFDSIDWKSKYNYLKYKLKDDDRFLDFLGEKFSGVDKKILSKEIDTYIQKLAAKEGMSTEKYAAKWTRKQMVMLIAKLKGNKRVKGLQQDLDESIQLSKVILAHLSSLDKQNGVIDDVLNKLRVGSKGEIKDPILKLKLSNHLTNQQVELKDESEETITLEEALLNLSTENQEKLKGALSALKVSNQIELEDALLKLAIEGGDYCGRGIKRAANELLWGILESSDLQASQEIENKPSGGVRSFEVKMLQALQNRRYKFIQNYYKNKLNQANVPNVIANDTHGFDTFSFFLTFGILPMTEYEQNSIGIQTLFTWEQLESYRQFFYQQYKLQLDDVVKDVGELHFGLYIRQIINENKLLNDEEKEKIIDQFTLFNDDRWQPDETLNRFHRLLFVRLGVLIPKGKPVS